ncbi:MAG: M56 family metallopeptidase, partial [Planctomycetota bacterium]
MRRDIFTQSVADFACAVFWFNPLSWFAAKQMRKLREIACDDLVVMRRCQPADYAETLLEVARSLRSPIPSVTVAMARSNTVSQRVLAIIDSSRKRSPLTHRSAYGLTVLVVLACVWTSVLQPTSIAQTTAELSQNTDEMSQSATDDEAETGADDEAESEKGNDAESKPQARTLRVRVVDEQGKPIEGASLFANIYDIERSGDFPNVTLTTNDQGELDVALPQKLGLLRLWPSKKGYVP